MLPRSKYKLEELLRKVVLLSLATYFAFFVINSAFYIQYPYQIDYGEGYLLNQAKIFSEGNWIYKDIDEPPFLISNYPPVYPLLVSFFIQHFGLSFI